MDKLIVTIETTNSAFDEDYGFEVARILRELANKFENGENISKLKDINGNTVGSVELE